HTHDPSSRHALWLPGESLTTWHYYCTTTIAIVEEDVRPRWHRAAYLCDGDESTIARPGRGRYLLGVHQAGARPATGRLCVERTGGEGDAVATGGEAKGRSGP